MSINSQIKGMTFKEKLVAMEVLWDEICHEEEMDSPDWHKQILNQRIVEAENKDSFTDWNTAKDDIRKTLK